ncbi:unnamed protein product [Phytophthora fragariaefolia]|uniref:Unnamed protein product n=1 Tax=Phytophthora fragariaefolia TaxID=1490495 RepID=A0A9W6U592_9STRA|nr:unnamed protein product [Phytophthora fragariaefolia]
MLGFATHTKTVFGYDIMKRGRTVLYVALAALRVVGSVLLLGMVHPDEFFQSQEVMARHALQEPQQEALRAQLHVPWEFQLPSPNRSGAGGGAAVQAAGAAGREAQRLVVAGDATSTAECDVLRGGRGGVCRRGAAESQPEARDPPGKTGDGAAATRQLVADARVPLSAFLQYGRDPGACPVLCSDVPCRPVELVRQQDTLLIPAVRKKDAKQPFVVHRLAAAVALALQGLLAFLTWAVAFIAIDTLYYRPELAEGGWNRSLLQKIVENAVIAPLNNLLYNAQYDNLELHGVHPRFTHLTVNMPMLFGPVFLVFLVRFLRYPDRSVFGSACVFFPLVCLSLAPHQEPRFLLPAIVPLHIFTALNGRVGVARFLTTHRFGLQLWIVFNFTLALFFGVFHQGGVVPMLLSLSWINKNSGDSLQASASFSWQTSSCRFEAGSNLSLIGEVPIVFVKTYMPPRFLLTGLTTTPAFRVIDLAGASGNEFSKLLSIDSPDQPLSEALLALPASVKFRDIIPEDLLASMTISKLGSCSPHISTEDLALDQTFSLDLNLNPITVLLKYSVVVAAPALVAPCEIRASEVNKSNNRADHLGNDLIRSIDEYLSGHLSHESLSAACEGGASKDILEYILGKTGPVWKGAVKAAVRGGHVHVLKWMTEREDGRGPWKADFDNALQIAASRGHLDVVKWLFERGTDWHTLWEIPEEKTDYIEKTWRYEHCTSEALSLAAEQDHLEVVQWIYNTRTDTCSDYENPISSAVAGGNLEIARWLYKTNGKRCSALSIDTAAENGHLQVLEWLHSNNLFTCTGASMEGVAGNGHFEVMKWLHRTQHESCSPGSLYSAVNSGNVELVEWLYENFYTRCHRFVPRMSATTAAEHGHLDVLKWLHAHFPDCFDCYDMAAASENGHMDVVTWLHEHRSEGCDRMASFYAARYGHFELLQWFHTHYPSSICSGGNGSSSWKGQS